MQYRMKQHPLSEERLSGLLARTQTGTLATLNPDGTPYCTPVHFVYDAGCFYIHGLPAGQKLDNILRCPKVGFSAFEMQALLLDEGGNPCDTNTKYESVSVTGTAAPVEEVSEKERVLAQIVAKYTPHLSDRPLPVAMVRGTVVLRLTVQAMTGKYYG